MNQQNSGGTTVIELSQAKQELVAKNEMSSFARYLKALSFSQLIDETGDLISDLNNLGSTKEIILKAKVLLKELSERFENSQGLSESFLVMRNELEGRINELY